MIENYLNNKYDFRYNGILNRTFYREKESEANFELLQNFKFNSIKRELNNSGISASSTDLRCLLESDFVPIYDPFKDYFNRLPEWDGVDYISQLIQTIDTNNDEDFAWAFTKWIVAAVACAIHQDVTNHTVLILTGGQGKGKSSWLKALTPKPLKDYFYSGLINPSNKDSILLMSEKFIICMDELASFNKNQIEAFKEMITKEVISERRAYGHYTENYVRRASFVGSSNHNEILMDVTGNRRFLCFEAIKINYEHNINMDLVYSQVMHLLNNTDFKYHFDKDDISRIEDNNLLYVQSSEENDWIDELFIIPGTNDDVEYMNATDIVSYIKAKKIIHQKVDIQLIGKLMKSKGYEKKKIKGIFKYIVTKK